MNASPTTSGARARGITSVASQAAKRPGRRFRGRRLALIAAGVATVFVLTGCLTVNQTKGLTALNNDRQAHRATKLGTQNDAQAKAQAWADHLAAIDKLVHSTLTDGIHVKYCALGENIGEGSSISTIEATFLLDTIHRNNVLGNWNGVGIGVAMHGSKVYLVQDFIRTC